jgi:hypothetical protein
MWWVVPRGYRRGVRAAMHSVFPARDAQRNEWAWSGLASTGAGSQLHPSSGSIVVPSRPCPKRISECYGYTGCAAGFS